MITQLRLFLPLLLGILFFIGKVFEPIPFLKFSEVPSALGIILLLIGGVRLKTYFHNKS